jgi:hypothetical protein
MENAVNLKARTMYPTAVSLDSHFEGAGPHGRRGGRRRALASLRRAGEDS